MTELEEKDALKTQKVISFNASVAALVTPNASMTLLREKVKSRCGQKGSALVKNHESLPDVFIIMVWTIVCVCGNKGKFELRLVCFLLFSGSLHDKTVLPGQFPGQYCDQYHTKHSNEE